MVVIIDNYDSFVYNLARYVGELGFERTVFRNDQISLAQIAELKPTHIILSPGPCTPNEAGICLPLIQEFAPTTAILGVCLGHQAIGQAFGGNVVQAHKPMHGKPASTTHFNTGVFNGLPNPLQVARYHSLIIDNNTLPDCLEITALSSEAEIMGVQHKKYNVHGVQFHPESILTESGYDLLHHFLLTVA